MITDTLINECIGRAEWDFHHTSGGDSLLPQTARGSASFYEPAGITVAEVHAAMAQIGHWEFDSETPTDEERIGHALEIVGMRHWFKDADPMWVRRAIDDVCCTLTFTEAP